MKQNRTDPAEKRLAAESLFAALGEMDDRYLTEAIEARRQPRKPRALWRTVLPLAVSLGLVLVLLTAGTVSLFGRLLSSGSPEAPSEADVSPSLSAILRSCTQSDAFTPCAGVAELPFSDGNTHVIIGAPDGSLWVSRPLTQREDQALVTEYSSASRRVDPDAPEEGYRVWISVGNGAVWTPCLTGGRGNISFDRLFFYEAEREPSASFTDLLAGIAG